MYFLTNLINAITMPLRILSSWLMRVIPGFRKIPAVSAPALIALTTLLFLLIVVTTFLFIYRSGDWGNKSHWDWVIAYLLALAIPIFVYWLVRVWMVKEESRYPELERVWEAGVEQCHSQGISLTNVPIFLVLGARDHGRAAQIMQAAQIPFSVTVPAENADLSWFANSEAVFLHVTGCSALSALSSAPAAPMASPQSPAPFANPDYASGSTIDASMLARGPGAPAGGSPFPAGSPYPAGKTINEEFGSSPSSASGTAASFGPVDNAGPQAYQGTILLPADGNLSEILGPGNQRDATATSAPQLSSTELFEREQKLRYLCGLIRKARQNLCPINGLISILPFHLVESACSQLQTAAQKDLAILRNELLVRCSNTVLVTELEKEEGFTELIKRVGEQRTREHRFGKGCALWNAPESRRLDAVAMHAVGAFEDWIYMLFQEENALKQRYNSRLFMLLCRIRGTFAQNLRAVLARGFGFDPQTESHLAHEQFLFGGCYFGAAGAEPGRQAFVKSVFMKGIQQEGELEWAPEARRRDAQLQWVANLFALLGTVAFVGILVMLALKLGPAWWGA